MSVKKNRQVAALPWRLRGDVVEVLMVTTRATKRWVIPKGWPMPGKADHDAAAQEAFEEAGVRGNINLKALGQFRYNKLLASAKSRTITVATYDLAVTKELDTWPEQEQRNRRWMSLGLAMQLASDKELVPLLLKFSERNRDEDQTPAKPTTWLRTTNVAQCIWSWLRKKSGPR